MFKSKIELKEFISEIKSGGKSLGFVPTMGALHDGHASLVKLGLKQCDLVVVSIFVNPTQFDNPEDLDKYPRTLERDTALLKKISEDRIFVYAPSVKDVYGREVHARDYNFGGIEQEMEGKFRTGHFDGVATVVRKLLEIVSPDKAFFGEKDFQQLQIIKKLVEIEQMPVEIVGCPIKRDPSGLAMSSRNERLQPEYLDAAPFIYQILKSAKDKFGTKSAAKVTEWVQKQFKNHGLLKLEYFTIANEKTLKPMKRKTSKNKYRAFIAAYAGDIRLIDNIALN